MSLKRSIRRAAVCSLIAAAILTFIAPAAIAGYGILGPKTQSGQRLWVWVAIGSGPSSSACDFTTGVCTATFTGQINGNGIGLNATVTSTLQWNLGAAFDNQLGTLCYIANGGGTITAALTRNARRRIQRRPELLDILQNQISLIEVGTLCGNSSTFSPAVFDGAYYVSGGTGKFTGSVGSGTATASSDQNGFVIFRVDGTLTAKGPIPPPG
ncbi:MAG: hypothetical protein ACREP6_04780 [Candidatus Binataceae bacterium]